MRRFLVVSVLALAPAAHADIAPSPLDPTSSTGILTWLAVVAAVSALALIWWRRRR